MRARLAPDVVRLIPSRLYGSLTCIFPYPGKMLGITEVLVVKKEKKKCTKRWVNILLEAQYSC